MNEAQRLILEMLQRADGFATPRTGDFAVGSKAIALIGVVHGAVQTATGFLTKQQSGGSGLHAGTSAKTEAYLALWHDIDDICRTARSIGDEVPGIEDKFHRPRSASDEAIKAVARTFLQDAPAFEAQFIEYELRADFLADLQADLTAFETAESVQDSNLDKQVEGTKGFNEALKQGLQAVRKLDGIIRNKYHNQPEIIAAWKSASHIERPARPKKTTTTP